MIRMQRIGRCSINLKCDQNGLDQLLAALEFIAEKREVEVEFDRRIINRKTTKFESRKMIFMLDSNRTDSVRSVMLTVNWSGYSVRKIMSMPWMLWADVKKKGVSILPSF